MVTDESSWIQVIFLFRIQFDSKSNMWSCNSTIKSNHNLVIHTLLSKLYRDTCPSSVVPTLANAEIGASDLFPEN